MRFEHLLFVLGQAQGLLSDPYVTDQMIVYLSDDDSDWREIRHLRDDLTFVLRIAGRKPDEEIFGDR